jgi:aspartyl protease family protein
MDGDTLGRVAYLVLLLLAVGGWVLVEYRKRLGQALRAALAWGLLFTGVMAGYGLWSDIRRDVQAMQVTGTDGAVEIPRAMDGHYYVTLQINDTPIRFMADTGATNMVLSRADAERLGIDPDGLLYDGIAQTANGTVRTARIRLPEVVLAGHRDTDFPAYVNEGEMGDSLLGMEYLARYRVEIAGDRMVLRR